MTPAHSLRKYIYHGIFHCNFYDIRLISLPSLDVKEEKSNQSPDIFVWYG